MKATSISPGRGQSILAQMGQIPVIVQGKVSERRSGGKVTGSKLQRWHNGRNETRHIPAEMVATFREGSAGYAQFMKLAQQYVEVRESEALSGACDRKKAHAAVDVWAQELHRFVDAASDTLQAKDLGDITWLELGLRDTSQGVCRDVLRWLLATPGLRVLGDAPGAGERLIRGQQRMAHTLFGAIPLDRNSYHNPETGHGRFPLDEALGLIDGYTPGVAALIGRCAAEHPFGQAEEAFHAYTGLRAQSRQFQRLAGRIDPLAERFLRADLPPANRSRRGCTWPPTARVPHYAMNNSKAEKDANPTAARKPMRSRSEHIFTQHPVIGQKPWRDLHSNTYVASTQRSQAFGQMLRAEYLRRFPDPADEVVFLGDGAAWVWELQRVFFPSMTLQDSDGGS